MSLKTHNRTVTDTDIINFANVTWDHFYAHTDITSLGGTIFEKRAAHGYFILGAAAGLFVYPNKGPVQANYGLDECRFLRPIYHNDTIYVRLTCKEKQDRDSKGREFPSGVVKWFVEVFDTEDELVATATVLTLVQKTCPFMEFSPTNVNNKLSCLSANDKPNWGTMTPQHVLEHLEFQFDAAVGNKEIDVITPEEKLERYGDSLYNYIPMPKNHKAPYLKDGELQDLEYENFEVAKEALLNAYEAYELYYKEHPEAIHSHPVFGPLNKEMWDLLNRKHFNHHFEQFGLL